MEEFILKTKIFMGENSIKNLEKIKMNKVMIICDPFLEKNGMTHLIKEILSKMNIEFETFSEVVPDPTIEVITLCLAKLAKFKPDTIIAFGGGSSMDTAKGVKELYKKMSENDVKLIAVPTTSGTGSEVTSFAVVSDPKTQSKYPLIDDEMIPEYAIFDANFTKTVPNFITADTGMDVLTHAIEAYVASNANDFTDAFAEKAIKLVWENLILCYEDPNNMNARTHMHSASCLAGIAFNQAGLGICHSLAHALGAVFHIPHGRANSVLLPEVIAYNAGLEVEAENIALDRYVKIANILGIACGTKKATVFKLVRDIKLLNKKFGIPACIKDLKIDTEEFNVNIEVMATKALEDRCTPTNPVVPTLEDLKGIYQKLTKGIY